MPTTDTSLGPSSTARPTVVPGFGRAVARADLPLLPPLRARDRG